MTRAKIKEECSFHCCCQQENLKNKSQNLLLFTLENPQVPSMYTVPIVTHKEDNHYDCYWMMMIWLG
jgi:hypothetical protein